jgi:CubicO group peptidase (beta-lactamase class C family)
MNLVQKPISTTLPMAKPEEVGLSSAALSRLSAVMRREVEAKHVPGVTMQISRRGKVAYRESVGALRPGGPPMTGDGIFRIYSMTKPIVSVAAMMLVEEGRLFLSDPAAKFIPEFADMKVGVEKQGRLELVPAKRQFTVHDLLRHTSGLTYGFLGDRAVQRLYAQAPLRSQDITSAGHVAELAKLPLLDQPGTHWHYSHSTDVLGRIVEIITGETLGKVVKERIFDPLDMVDTGFFAPPEKHERLAEAFPKDPDTGAAVELIETRVEPKFESGGGGLVSTIEDYSSFAHMLYYGGSLGGARLLGRKTVAFMASDHLGPGIVIGSELLQPGHGFGLGFAVRRESGLAPTAGTVGEFFWGGIAGTVFFIAPAEELVAIMLIQAPGQRDYYRQLFRSLVHAALI